MNQMSSTASTFSCVRHSFKVSPASENTRSDDVSVTGMAKTVLAAMAGLSQTVDFKRQKSSEVSREAIYASISSSRAFEDEMRRGHQNVFGHSRLFDWCFRWYIQDAASCLICSPHQHTAPLFKSLCIDLNRGAMCRWKPQISLAAAFQIANQDWLTYPQLITFNLCLLAYRCFHSFCFYTFIARFLALFRLWNASHSTLTI